MAVIAEAEVLKDEAVREAYTVKAAIVAEIDKLRGDAAAATADAAAAQAQLDAAAERRRRF